MKSYIDLSSSFLELLANLTSARQLDNEISKLQAPVLQIHKTYVL